MKNLPKCGLWFWTFALVFIFTICEENGSNAEDVLEYCEWESFNATCGRNEIILIGTAKYGRMIIGRCITKNYGHIGCGTDVTLDFHRNCSGRRHCLISVISLHNKRSCPKDFKSYLEASFSCQSVISNNDSSTCPKEGHIAVSSSEGKIASILTQETGLGSENCPWVIQVQPHQKINLTLLDFGLAPRNDPWEVDGLGDGKCSVYAVVMESNETINHTICAGTRREQVVYESKTNSIRLYIPSSSNHKSYFMFKYQAFGCPPLEAPFKAVVRTNGDHAIIRCNETDEAWYLTCRGRDWIGLSEVHNCSDPVVIAKVENDWSIDDVFGSVTNFPFGILIVVALGVAMGVAIGVIMLVVVLAYMRRRRRRKIRSRSNYVLKHISGNPDQGKREDQATFDRTPMLLKREPADGNTISRDYLNTWKIGRSGPLPKPPSGTPEMGSLMRGVVLTPDPNLPSPSDDDIITHGFSTFRPTHLIDCDLPETQRNAYILQDGVNHEGPYYFKLDPTIARREHGHKPDVVQGPLSCALCRANGIDMHDTDS